MVVVFGGRDFFAFWSFAVGFSRDCLNNRIWRFDDVLNNHFLCDHFFHHGRRFGFERTGSVFGRLTRRQGKHAHAEQDRITGHMKLQLSFDRARSAAYLAGLVCDTITFLSIT